MPGPDRRGPDQMGEEVKRLMRKGASALADAPDAFVALALLMSGQDSY